ncbi:MAG: beta strand repeat-containing protein, partial [Ilumatobacteraceae bacterium]
VVVTTGGGDSVPAGVLGATADDFDYTAPTPTVTSLSPNFGAIAGGTTVTITGTGFVTGATVLFGTEPGLSPNVTSPTSMTIVSPAGSLGVVDVKVTTAGGPSSTTGGGDNFTYADQPTVTGLSATAGPVAGGATITVSGSGFLAGSTTARFNSTAATNVSVVSPTSLTLTVPASAVAGTVDVFVTTIAGTSTASAASAYSYVAVPVISGLSPSSGPLGGGTSVVISGSNLANATSVTFDGVAGTVTANTPTSITVTSPSRATAGAVPVVVTTVGGSSTPGGTSTFTYVARPVVSQLTPASGTWRGGTTVVINGSNLTGALEVSFGSTAATTFTVNSASQITATAPASVVAADVFVTVRTVGGTSATGTDSTYTYFIPRPVVTSVTPSFGLLAGGNQVTIVGTDLDELQSVTIGGAAAAVVSGTATQIVVTVPERLTRGTVDVIVTTLATQPSAGGAGSQYTYVTTPTVTDVSPSTGTVDGGTSVTITGTDFYTVTGVTFGGVNATTFTVVNPTTITATTASTLTASTVNVSVTALGGTSAYNGTLDNFTFTTAAPAITSISPANSPIAGTGTITITGTSFAGPASVFFGDVEATGVVVVSRTQITATIPAASAGGTVRVRVVTPGGTSPDTAADDFTYASAPSIDQISPAVGSVVGGTVVTITGTDFVGVSTSTGVTFDGVAATSIVVNSSTSITATAPSRASAGIIDVRVIGVAGTSANTAADDFRYYAVPVITSLSPVRSSLDGASVTINGENLLGVTSVTVGGAPAAIQAGGTDTVLTVTAPSRATAGTVDVRVTTPGGISANTAADNFRYVAAPTVTLLSRTSGPVAGGQSITITGTDFVDVNVLTGVTFGGVAATGVTVVSETEITATIPAAAAGAAGIAQVTVTALGGTSSTDGTANDYRYFAIPAVASLQPASGTVSGGTTVTITGQNLLGVTGVVFGSAAASVQPGGTDTQLTVISPAGTAGEVQVRVTTPGGTSDIGAGSAFTYVSIPVVSEVNPNKGPVAGGGTVTITGSNFTGATSVKFGAASAAFTVDDDSTITATVPSGAAGTVDVVVTTTGGPSSTAGSGNDYSYFAVPAVTSLSPASGPEEAGTSVVISGDNLTGATEVMFGESPAVSFTIASGVITAVAPAGTKGTVQVTVTTPGGTSSVSGSGNDYRYYAKPAVASLAPSSGPLAAGTSVTINGTNLEGVTSVLFGTTTITTFSLASDTAITLSAPAGAAGGVQVRVTTPGGTSDAVAGSLYTYVALPVVSSLSKTSAPLSGTSLTITGLNLTGATAVKFGSESAAFTVVDSTTITTTAPSVLAKGTVQVTVTTAGGTSSTTGSGDDFRYVDVPVIDSLTPAAGPIAGEQTVVIAGSEFVGVTAVRFGDNLASVVNVTDTSITVTTPAGAVGQVDVSVTAVGGSTANTAADNYRYYAIPVISSLTPSRGPLGGTSVTIAGQNLLGVTSVTFDGTAATIVSAVSDTSITVTAPARAAGTVNVVVTTPGGPSANTANDDFRYVGLTTVTSVDPAVGPVGGGTVVTITGTNFVGVDVLTGVTVGGIAATGVVVDTESQITATVPASVSGAGIVDVVVTGVGGASSPTGTANDFRYYAMPVVETVSPNAGPIAGGQTVVIGGQNLLGVTAVKFGTATATVTASSETSLTVTAPANAKGTISVTVATPGGTTSAVGTDNDYTYFEIPAVTAVAPSRGPLGGTVVTITGQNLLGVTAVSFGGTLASTFNATSDTSITVTTPTRPAGTVQVSVTTPGGTSSTAGDGDEFRFVGLPVVDSVTPASGPVAGGTPVTIIGSNFVDVNVATGVTFGGVAATNVVVKSETEITATVPASTTGAGTVQVEVTGIGGTSLTAGTGNDYRYFAMPVVGTVSPTAGPTTGGTSVTITGQNLLGVTAVSFGATAAVTFTATSDTSITVTSPARAAGTVAITVTTPGGTSTPVGTEADFRYFLQPAVSSIVPAHSAQAGREVVINGSNFLGVTSVKFGDALATTFTVDSDIKITATAPAGSAGMVEVTVTSPGGTSSTTGTANDFTYWGVPTIANVSPAAGPVAGNQTVVITGTGFQDVTSVTFGGATATVTASTTTSITVTTPASAAGPVDISVTAVGGTSVNTAADNYTYYGFPSVTAISTTTGPSAGGTTVTITGTDLLGATAVRFGTTDVASFTVVDNTRITAVTAVTPAGPADVRVVTPGGTTANTTADDFTFYDAPTITTLSPNRGATAGGTSVTITGTNFVAGLTVVSFGGAAGTSVNVTGPTSLTVVAPAASAGQVEVTVTTPGGTSQIAGTANDFTYWAAPSVTALLPSSGPIAGGTSVTVTGTNFDSVTGVTFGGVAGTSVNVTSTTSLTVVAPAGSIGTVDVVVTATGGTSATDGTGNDYRYFGIPAISSLSTQVGPTAGGTSVTITGTNLLGVTAVRFGSTAALFTSVSDASITVTSPALAAGKVDVSVVTPGGTSSVTGTADDFTYYDAPSVSALAPSKSALAGTTVPVTGTNFVSGLTSVSFGANAGTGVSVLSATSLTVVAPAGSAGTVDVTVTTPGGTSSTAGAGNDFTYWAAPTITSVAPAGGPLTSGTSVVITGTGFDGVSGAAAVQFGGVNAVSYTVNSETQITATAPAGSAGTVEVTVTGTGGTNSTTGTGNDYTYYAVPAIGSLSPTSGPGQGGTPVVITGTNFLGATAVRFGATN